ncbi:thiamine ABC transporter ATP-binding protein [Roseisalinus antarcticus]|uniref:Thiamine import ATP-binding protein ThiQ n=1 Tax=Roseisalinus antarcticus TaxID=254357 RepID=A0A1Y5TYJ3_9RHOB|nr:ATP-binding cassette domain-containing protein [Roseisalinus antarcticus]SLN75884.1 Thiamine import ATP-binding protein ThiQ [Roseisalinus antarcticus]
MLTLESLVLQQGAFRLEADLTVGAGVTAVIGPSGGGKSTLLAAIGGFLDPALGHIRIDGRDMAGLAPHARPVAQLFQDGNLFPHLTVAQNVMLGIAPGLGRDPARDARVEEVLARVGLSGLGARKPGALSGGQQSRAALARVLVQDAPLVLLDEPFAALGPGLKAEMLILARDVLAAPGRTLLMVTHDPGDAERVADTVLLVADGRVTGPHDRAALFADPPAALREYLG